MQNLFMQDEAIRSCLHMQTLTTKLLTLIHESKERDLSTAELEQMVELCNDYRTFVLPSAEEASQDVLPLTQKSFTALIYSQRQDALLNLKIRQLREVDAGL